jgi:polyhydroxyalkanoate synthase
VIAAPNVPFSLIDQIESAETALHAATEHVLHDDAVLDACASSWRAWLAGIAALPRDVRSLAAPIGLPRGTAPVPSGLGDDYPLGVLELVRTLWVTAARTLAMHALPFGLADSRRGFDLADRLACVPPPAFAPTRTRVVLATRDFRMREVLATGAVSGTPIVVVSSLINRWYTLDFRVGQSFVAMLSSLGRPVYVLEWLPPSAGDDRSLGDLCAGSLLGAVDSLRRDGVAPAIVGYSMGGTIAACLAARHPDRVGRLATVCSPIRFDRGGAFARWLSARFLDVDLVTAAFDRVPAHLVHAPFWWLRPSIKLAKLVQLVRELDRPGHVEQFLATEVWNHDNVDLSRGVFRSWVGELYQGNALLAGTFVIGGEPIGRRRIACPVLAISGTADSIVPPEAAEGITELCEPGRAELLRLDAGHVGVLTSRRALAAQAAAFARWLDQEQP